MSKPDVTEILKKVRHIQIVANRAVNDLFAGQYKSVFRGRGMEFDEVREYQPGDDVRTIDWNVTARTGAPFVKRFCEERELTVIFLVDISASGAFGSGERSKLDMVVEVAAMLMFSALKNNDKVGLITFCDDVIDYFPPRKGKVNVLHLIRQLVAVEPVPRETDLNSALEFLSKVQKRRAVAFMISDFLAPPARHAMAVCSKRHDLIAMTVADPRAFVDLPGHDLVQRGPHALQAPFLKQQVGQLFQGIGLVGRPDCGDHTRFGDVFCQNHPPCSSTGCCRELRRPRTRDTPVSGAHAAKTWILPSGRCWHNSPSFGPREDPVRRDSCPRHRDAGSANGGMSASPAQAFSG